jgi:hypothetical protein
MSQSRTVRCYAHVEEEKERSMSEKRGMSISPSIKLVGQMYICMGRSLQHTVQFEVRIWMTGESRSQNVVASSYLAPVASKRELLDGPTQPQPHLMNCCTS